MKPLALLLTVALAPAALAQATPETPTPDDLRCAATPGGAECEVDIVDGAILYCLAMDEAGEPLANSTVSSDAGVAVFNAVDVTKIADVTCRVE